MIGQGAGAPDFAVPAVVDGERERVALEDHLGRSVVVLAFYPGDFNPACDATEAGLADLELFSMRRGVDVLAISGDGIASHRAFADRYGLSLPLLSDVHGTVAADYDVLVDDPSAGHLVDRGVVVIAPSGEIVFSWSAGDRETLPPVEAVREAVDGAGGRELALERYRLGHADYVRGRTALVGAVDALEAAAWDRAERDARRAARAFAGAGEHFKTAAEFLEDDAARGHARLADDRTGLCRQAADRFGEAAATHAAGDGVTAEATRQDAERAVERARASPDPPGPAAFPPDEPPDETGPRGTGEPADGGLEDGPDVEAADADPGPETSGADGNDGAIDDAELEEITAEIQRQTGDGGQ